MTSYQFILFDLDGTLVDSSVGIYHSFQAALSAFNRDISFDNFISNIGPPTPEIFQTLFPELFSDQKKLKKALRLQRFYYAENGITESTPYPGVINLLKALQKAGKKIGVATSKPTVFAKKILAYQHLLFYFDVVTGSTLNLSRTKKTDIIAHVLKKFPHIPLKNIIMIGDRHHDIHGAQENKIHSIGVTYGYGSDTEIRNANPTYIAHNTTELLNLILNPSNIHTIP